MKIFIADDDQIIRAGLRSIINRYLPEQTIAGEAADGKEALEAIMANHPDLLITDIKMPLMDGIELIREIKSRGMEIKIIVLSGFDEYSYVRESLKNGAEDYLLKPVESAALFDLIKKIELDIENERKLERKSRFIHEAVNKTIDTMKGRMLKKLMEGEYGGLEDFMLKSPELDLTGEKWFVFALVDTDCPGEEYWPENGRSSLLETAGFKGFIEAMDLEEIGVSKIFMAEQERQVSFLFTSRDETPGCIQKKVITAVEMMMGYIKNALKTNLSCGLSHPYSDIRKTHISCFQASHALGRRFYEGGNRILHYSPDSGCYVSGNEKNLVFDLNTLMNGIELGQPFAVRKSIEGILYQMASSRIDPKDFRKLWSGIVRKISVRVQDFRDILEESGDKSMEHFMDEIGVLSDFREYLMRAFGEIVEKINAKREEKSKRSVEIAKAHIRNHYKAEINLKSIAELVNLNPNYFSDLFKSETGKNFVDFVIETRISAAKKLLAQHDVKVYEIAEAVGYNDPTSFNRAFKKIVGISPAEYRRIIK